MDTKSKTVNESSVAGEELVEDQLINASGHRQELQRNFNLLNICAVAITTGNTWVALGGSVVGLYALSLPTAD